MTKMNYDYCVAELIKNPNYDSDWVNIAAKILSEFPEEDYITEENLAKFTDKQLNFIYEAIKSYGDQTIDPDQGFINMLMNPKLNHTQMQLIYAVKQNKVPDGSIYKLINPSIPYSKLNFLVKALIDNQYDIFAEYGDKVYEMDDDQIYEIYAAKMSNVDITPYKDQYGNFPSAEKMSIIRHALELGLEVTVEYDVVNKAVITIV